MAITVHNSIIPWRSVNFSITLETILKHCKKSDSDLNYESIKECLKELYHPDIKLMNVLQILIEAYVELLKEPRFECNQATSIEKIILAPIDGTSCLGNNSVFGPSKEDRFTVEEFYNSMIIQLLNQFRFSRVDWCSDLFNK